MLKLTGDPNDTSRNHNLLFKGASIAVLNEVLIAQYAAAATFTEGVNDILPVHLMVDSGVFTNKRTLTAFPDVIVNQQADGLVLSCDCQSGPNTLCEHQAQVLTAIIKREELRVFYDQALRHEKIKKIATDYGLENEKDLDAYFSVSYSANKIQILPVSHAILPVTKDSLAHLHTNLLPQPASIKETGRVNVVIRQHRYYKYLNIELYTSQLTLEGKLKNPLKQLSPLDFVWETEDHEQLKFFTGIQKFQNRLDSKLSDADLTALKAIVRNPLGYDFYYHNQELGEKVTAGTLIPVSAVPLPGELKLTVNAVSNFVEINGFIQLAGAQLKLQELRTRFTYFISDGELLYLPPNLQVLNLISLFAGKEAIAVHATKFGEFKTRILSPLEDHIAVNYKYIPKATPQQLEKQGFTADTERIIYLSDFGTHVMLIPVMRYGEVEISVLTKRQIYSADTKGHEFLVQRDEAAELNFTTLLIRQHAWFEEQLENGLHYFYLHKRHFLNEDWFLDVFEQWQDQGITILGFNELEGNKLNPNKVKITIQVLSGINWFNALVDARFGRKRAALKQIYRAVKNKSRYVQLDDGTQGILPAEWLAKFETYFNAGEIAAGDTLAIPKVNYTVIEELFEAAMLDEKVSDEISVYRQRLADFATIRPVAVPEELTGTLRPYQQQGLNWLNFLDDFNFGGCLADDMGLGKSIQVIAFILSQRRKTTRNTNLVVVPTSLIFNWEQELRKFAPSIRVLTIYGGDRVKNTAGFDAHEVILTSYGTLLQDINFLKDFAFNYVFLDESQQIKNPESQRYKAARLLQSRNRIVITGTPIENNTFDLYGQLSFACPGLLGSKNYFKAIYSSPIDKFKSSKRAAELQQKIAPFILRRTKEQVATELPEKTEMILHCGMGAEQRRIYDAYETEFRDYISALNGDVLKKSAMNVLKGLTKLRQICDSPSLIKGDKLPGDASAKIAVLLEQLEEKSPRHKILVFSQFVGMLDLIGQELVKRNIGHCRLTGQTRNRPQVIQEFQTDNSKRVFLISLKAGGTGLNLTEADYVYLVDPWWNPAVENQAIDRCHRIGQDKPVIAIRLICPGTVEEKIQLLQEDKKTLAGQLIHTDAGRLGTFSKEALLDLFAPANVDGNF
ncbi:Superfamily II DNA or RNA helicase, SNF2 family [Mucilaginibacter pineti]|uniref:Superfamily II DNA or RNA helicase, SNF2 family n=1 Tax=Mucilaginibacter pineti TaxID=1391627 RepID=A0A1G6ZK67_9SPHI|nr:DEAD/DEAH box helicase [Mucilaginibacter pineti]SDE03039.1 Superfamily II DNA or RNA helicase, SNF2 family [Mucilaginibacter pineti]